MLAVGGDQQIVPAIVGNQVSLDAPLRAEDKAVHATSGREVADVVGDHAIQPAHAVLSRQHQLGLPAHVEEGTALQQGMEFSRGITEIGRRFRAAIHPQVRAAGRELLLKGSNTHTESLIIAKAKRKRCSAQREINTALAVILRPAEYRSRNLNRSRRAIRNHEQEKRIRRFGTRRRYQKSL